MKRLILILLLLALSSIQPPSISFTILEISIGSELKAIASFDKGTIAVGEKGLVAIAYNDGGRLLEKPVDIELKDISCIGSRCLAVGGGGVVLEIDALKKTFKTVKISDAELYKVASSGRYFYIASSRGEIVVYSLDKGVIEVYQYGGDIVDIVYGDKLYILMRDGVKILGGDILKIRAEKVAWVKELGLIVLNSSGVYSISKNASLTLGRYEDIAPCSPRSFTLSSGNIMYMWSMDYGLKIFSTLTFKPVDIACSMDKIYAIGPRGYYAEASKNGSKLLFAPSGKYTTASSDNGLAVVAGEKVLFYEDGYFKEVEAPGRNYKSSSLSNGLAILLGDEKIVAVSEDGVKILPYRVGEYNDLWLEGDRLLLAGRNGLIEASLEELNIRELYSGGELYSVSRGGAVGKNVIVTSSREYRVNVSLKSVDTIPCGLLAVGDKGALAVLREDSIDYVYATGGENLRSVAVKPDSSYALIGGASGGLYLWDGYRVSQLPYRASGEVSEIAWINNSEALIIAGGRILLFREEGYGEPRLEVGIPETFRIYNGSEKSLKITLNPLNGYTGTLEPTILTDIEGVSIMVAEKLDVKPLCPTFLEAKIKTSPEARGSGKLSIILDGVEREVPLIIEVRSKETGGKSESILLNPTITMIIGVLAVAVIVLTVVLKMFKKPPRPEAPKPGEEEAEKGWEKPQEGGEGEEW